MKNWVSGRNKNRQGEGGGGGLTKNSKVNKGRDWRDWENLLNKFLMQIFLTKTYPSFAANHKIKKAYSLCVKGKIVLCIFDINVI